MYICMCPLVTNLYLCLLMTAGCHQPTAFVLLAVHCMHGLAVHVIYLYTEAA
jgi:hypothetical protein